MRTPLADRLEREGRALRTWPYGTRKSVRVMTIDENTRAESGLISFVTVAEVEAQACYMLVNVDVSDIHAGDLREIVFREGGPLGGYWDFVRDEAGPGPGALQQLPQLVHLLATLPVSEVAPPLSLAEADPGDVVADLAGRSWVLVRSRERLYAVTAVPFDPADGDPDVSGWTGVIARVRP